MPAARRALCFGPSISQLQLHCDFDVDYVSSLWYKDSYPGSEGRFLETILKDGAREWRPTLRREPQRGRSGPRPPGLMAWRGQSLRLRFHCREPASWVRIRKSPRWSAERGPGRPGTGWSRVAGATERMSAPVGAPSTPHRGDGIAAVATAAGVKAPWARRRTRKRRHMRRDGQPGRSNAPRERTTLRCLTS